MRDNRKRYHGNMAKVAPVIHQEESPAADQLVTRFRFIDEVLEKSPDIPGYGGGKWAMYSTGCCWWTSFPEDLGTVTLPGASPVDTAKGVPVKSHQLPCCPHCGNLLMQAPLKKFIAFAKAHPGHYGHFGIDALLEAHSRNSSRCYQKWNAYNRVIIDRLMPGGNLPQTYA